MNNAFAAAMSRALEQTRAGNSAEATRIIQAALGQGSAAQGGLPLPSPAPMAARPRIEDAELVAVRPPKAAPAAAAADGDGAATAGFRPGDLQQMLGRMGCLGPQGSVLPQGLMAMPRTNAAPALPPGARYETRRFASALGARDYRLFLPSGIGDGARGLIVMLHGCTQDPDDFARGTDMNSHAERAGLIVVYPHQTRAQNPQGCWNWFRPQDQGAEAGEAALLAALTRAVAAEFAVPQDSIFAAGLSAGGAMAATLAATQPDLFAAVGIHSGLPHGAAHDIPSAFGAMRGQGERAGPALRGTVRMIVFHGTADATVHPSNAERLVAAARPALPGAARHERGSAGGRSYRRDVVEADDGTPLIESWRIDGAGHAWSGGRSEGSYADPAGPDASAQMVRFFLHRQARQASV
ncbi:extracellular catalytic domain type 1 short-chain-length polyhydroxyalkanoate depolymerase [Paracoccus sp. (in: a-proteobacteria)]|uniref:extracellular catalytic domain type 1 short-chain-length polyhydroxyalkanoate depolymerase n=1 Tax=Paracoccus sp. TaxID=267 RepID=UPI00272AB877|nr:PHB depolymerase family esterase [Paracoccus sp. (in: a-proteobacteria)]